MLSVIIPAFNEQDNVSVAIETISRLLHDNKIEYEIVVINDGSEDNTWEEILSCMKTHNELTAINFSRNFGKESAIFAGLKNVSGDACVIIDCDLQHPPEKIIDMYNIWLNNDVDIVEAVKSSRGKENIFYSLCAKVFYKIMGDSAGVNMNNSCDFKLLDRQVIDALNAMPERLTFFRAMSGWVGFKTEKINIEVKPRKKGKTKWSLPKLFRYAFNSITSYSSAPMQIVTFVGIVTFIISVIMAVDTLYNKLSGRSLEGFSTVILLQLFTSSVIMFSLGIIGYYLAKIYDEIKKRPRYIITEIKKGRIQRRTNEKNL